MSNSKAPAFPVPLFDGDALPGGLDPNGLTKREYFAALALHGLLASWGQHDVTSPDELAYDAISPPGGFQ